MSPIDEQAHFFMTSKKSQTKIHYKYVHESLCFFSQHKGSLLERKMLPFGGRKKAGIEP